MPAKLIAARRSHYENAFEDYLRVRNVPFVAVSEASPHTRGRLNVKAFDYIVYPESQIALLIDVKGRKFGHRSKNAARRWESWVTRGDVDGLTKWQEVFGPEFRAAFVFAYWLAHPVAQPAAFPEVHSFAGRTYAFWGIDLDAYRAHLKQRSQRWKTVDLSKERFIQIAWPLSQWTLR